MARKDFYYPPIRVEMMAMLDYIVEHAGKREGYNDSLELIRKVLADHIRKYEEKYGQIPVRKAVRTPKNTEVQQPDDE